MDHSVYKYYMQRPIAISFVVALVNVHIRNFATFSFVNVNTFAMSRIGFIGANCVLNEFVLYCEHSPLC